MIFVEPSNPVVKRFVDALNAGDREAFFAVLTPDATMSDDGSERGLREWTEREHWRFELSRARIARFETGQA
jgi:ketosteroid isomerase-like protein